MKYDLRSMYDAVLIGNSPSVDAAWTHGFYGGGGSGSADRSGGSASHFAHSSSSNLAGMATIRKRDHHKRRSQLPNPKKVYEEAQMSRKVSRDGNMSRKVNREGEQEREYEPKGESEWKNRL